MKIAKERKSSVLASNAIHHRIDSLTSIVALLTIGGAHVFTDASWLDPVGGIIISAMVIRAGWSNTLTSLLELADVAVDDEIKQSVTRSATKALKGDPARALEGVHLGNQVEVKDVQGIKSGQNYLMDIDLMVPASFTVEETTAIEKAVRERVGTKVRGVRRVRVKFTTRGEDEGWRGDFIGANISPRSSPEPEDEHDHDHEHSHSNGHAHEHKKHQ